MKAQLKIFESVAVLVVFFFLVAIGMNFYFTFQESSLKKEIRQIQDQQSLEVAKRIAYLPELDCNLLAVVREMCIDRLKLEALATVLSTTTGQQTYFPILGYSTITVIPVYPGTLSQSPNVPQLTIGQKSQGRVLYDRKRAASGTSSVFNNPMKLYDPITGKFSFVVLEVRTYA